ncbi:hypothetical protein OAY22_02975 [Acidimicrobiia bacterium]|nr:hypothetical protein [Acidimicrobiia bacterium]
MKYKEEVIKDYLLQYIEDNDLIIDNEDSDIHDEVFNQDYFIIGYYNAEQWLIDEQGNNRTFEVLSYVMEQEKDNFGAVETVYDNAETLVNHYAYWLGYEVIADTLEEMKEGV